MIGNCRRQGQKRHDHHDSNDSHQKNYGKRGHTEQDNIIQSRRNPPQPRILLIKTDSKKRVVKKAANADNEQVQGSHQPQVFL